MCLFFFIYRCICVVHCLHLCIYRSFGLRIFFIHSFLVYLSDLFHPFITLFCYLPTIYYSSIYSIYFMSRPFILLDISAFLLYCFLVSPLVYQFICWVLIFLCIYLFMYLMLVFYLQKSFCKPLQISQIEYSDGSSICLLFSLLL